MDFKNKYFHRIWFNDAILLVNVEVMSKSSDLTTVFSKEKGIA